LMKIRKRRVLNVKEHTVLPDVHLVCERRTVKKPRHEHTAVAATEAATLSQEGRRARCSLWDLSAQPKWAPPVDRRGVVSPGSAVSLELRCTRALARLRDALAERCAGRGLKRLRPLTFERWRFAAKWEEMQAARGSSKPKQSGHPLLPVHAPLKRQRGNKDTLALSGNAEQGLADDLVLQGLSVPDAAAVARQLCQESSTAAAKAVRERHEVVSGKELLHPPMNIAFHRHSIDIICGGRFVKISHNAYGKLSVLHRRHAPANEKAPEPLDGPEDVEEREALAAKVEYGTNALTIGRRGKHMRGVAKIGPIDGARGTRGTLHQRMFSLLLRYKSLGGHGFQA